MNTYLKQKVINWIRYDRILLLPAVWFKRVRLSLETQMAVTGRGGNGSGRAAPNVDVRVGIKGFPTRKPASKSW
ncbi:hypothetical protein [Spirosoma fluviale]|uniref:hypothetical protein n=1 Tax=Spirosoma fluviale TaxID=1597977 RepID=UPI0011819463|nr:hypothetical protein [Spirosoma fluviale]